MTNDLTFEAMTAKTHPGRWQLHRAGIVNVWFYYDATFEFSGGRCIWRGTNGAGKSRALELLLPFLLDADRRRMDATGQGKVRLEELMRAGGNGEGNRLGYLWLELERLTDDGPQYLTLGALVRFSHATAKADAWYFTTPLRVGHDLALLGPGREPLPRAQLTELIGADRITDSPATHRDRVRFEVFGLHGDNGLQRFTGLMQLLHTLRAPDVGNKIDDGNLTKILAEAMPPLSETTLADAGSKLDALRETREAQSRLAGSRDSVQEFLEVYSRYASATLRATVADVVEAAAAAGTANGEAKVAVDLQEQAREEKERAQVDLERLEEDVTRLGATVDAIRRSDRYAKVEDLAAQEEAAKAIKSSADQGWRTVRTAAGVLEREVGSADQQAAAVAAAVGRAGAKARQVADAMIDAHLPHHLALTWDVTRTAAVVRQETWCRDATADAQQHTVPGPDVLHVQPADLDAVVAAAQRARTAASTRRDIAQHRASIAHDLNERLERLVRQEHAVERQRTDATEAAQSAEDKSNARDASAVALAQAWAAWARDDTTTELLRPVQWPQVLADVLTDSQALTGDRDDDSDVASLREVPADLAREPLETLREQASELRRQQRQDDEVRTALQDEDRRLERAHDPAPPAAPGHTADLPDGIPLWQAVEFTDDVPDHVQAGIEAALLASGMLTASLSARGARDISDGQVLVDATGPLAARNLTAVLRPDPASELDRDVTRAVLERVGWNDLEQPVSVTQAGAWRNGHLRGAHTRPAAVHVGAAARAAARAARRAQIAAEIDALDTARDDRARALQALQETTDRVRNHLRTAPTGDAVIRLRSSARTLQQTATRLETKARDAARVVEEARAAWTLEHLEHTRACAHQDLDPDVGRLRTLVTTCTTAVDGCDALAELMDAIAAALAEHERRTAGAAQATSDLDHELGEARTLHARWVQVHTELTTLQQTIGADREAAMAELRAAEFALQTAESKQKALRTRLQDVLIGAAAEALALVRETERDAERLTGVMNDKIAHLHAQAQLRGVLPAAVGDADVPLPAVDDRPADVTRACRGALAVLPAGSVGARQIDAAIQTMATRLAGVFDVTWDLEHDMRIVTLTDVTGSWPATTAHATLHAALLDGQAALNDQERRVFTTFVLQGVAGELGARLRQALALVHDMNTSLQHIRTGQGIRLSVAWAIPEDTAPEMHELAELAMGSYDTRSEADDDRLVTLIKTLVDRAADLDPSAGYTAHLQAALDYRAWHKMSVFILGPGTRERRPITPRSKLSQGETRFVSYATLFAAMDAFLTGLPDTGLALRLVLLDDAFAKIDNVVVAQFLGLLVSLDLDFAMTGHGLWGTVAQVPALDVYEVRRNNGPAITTHVHWDGYTRHLQPVHAGAGAP